MNSKSPILKFGGNRIRQISVKFAKFVNPKDTKTLNHLILTVSHSSNIYSKHLLFCYGVMKSYS
jgi:hypothetical protein